MANPEHVAIVKQGAAAIAAWREGHPGERLDLHGANLDLTNLRGADLREVNLSLASLRKADLREADLNLANLIRANLGEANLHGVNLSLANLRSASLEGADLRKADLSLANLSLTDLRGASLSGVDLFETSFGSTNLCDAQGLETCKHVGPSYLDHFTLIRSGGLPEAFLRGCGWPDVLIVTASALLNESIQFYSCFISYSHSDEDFAKRLHADLQAEGVRCWFAPENLKIGDRFQDTIDQAIRMRDKLLVILSVHSLASEWVEDEIQAALEEERGDRQRRTILFPLRIDDAIEDTELAWAKRIKRTRHIGDFSHWKDHDAYQAAFERLLRALRADEAASEP